MRECQPLGLLGVSGDEGVENSGVLLPYLARPCGLPKDIGHGPVQKAPVRLRRCFDHRISGSRVDHSVQRLIQSDLLRNSPSPSRGGFVARLQDGPTLPLDCDGEWPVSHRPLCDDAGCVSVECGANTVMLKHGTASETRDEKAAPSAFFDDPIGLQPRHRLLDRLSGNAQAFGKLLLSQVCTRCQASVADFIYKGVVHLVGETGRKVDRQNNNPCIQYSECELHELLSPSIPNEVNLQGILAPIR